MTLLLAAVLIAGQAPDAPSKLPIDVPKSATVTFEADAAGPELVSVIRQLLGAGFIDPSGSHSAPIVVKTQFGEIGIKPEDVAELMRPIRELHIVTYSGTKGDEPLRRFEAAFKAEGMDRVAYSPESGGFLLMRRRGGSGRFAAVVRQKDNVTVVRTDGMPNLGIVGQVLLRTLGEAALHKK